MDMRMSTQMAAQVEKPVKVGSGAYDPKSVSKEPVFDVGLGSHAPKGISKALALSYKASGLNNQEIADKLGCTPENITIILRSTKGLVAFKRFEPEVLTHLSRLVLDRLISNIDKVPLNILPSLYGILFDKRRLMAGETTNNVGISGVLTHIEELKTQARVLEVELSRDVPNREPDLSQDVTDLEPEVSDLLPA